MENYVTLNLKECKIEKEQVAQKENQKSKSKAYCHLKMLESRFNPDSSRIVNDLEQGRDITLE
jgi:hypothetical protein